VKQEETLTIDQLDARLVVQTLAERAQLWRSAEGRLGWRSVVGLVLSVLFIVIGVSQSTLTGELPGFFRSGSALFLTWGFGLLALTAWVNMQVRLRATIELLRQLERARL